MNVADIVFVCLRYPNAPQGRAGVMATKSSMRGNGIYLFSLILCGLSGLDAPMDALMEEFMFDIIELAQITHILLPGPFRSMLHFHSISFIHSSTTNRTPNYTKLTYKQLLKMLELAVSFLRTCIVWTEEQD